jgi:DNA topoisomerase-1
VPPPGHQWGKIIHDDTVTWLAMWRENINGAFKYVFLAAGSSLKGQSDFKKFEKARELKVGRRRTLTRASSSDESLGAF